MKHSDTGAIQVNTGAAQPPVSSHPPPLAPADLREHGIDEAQAASLRFRLQCIAEDWERPEMAAAYDDH